MIEALILEAQVNLKSSIVRKKVEEAMTSPSMSIGALAARAGVAASTLRFYEDEGLLHGTRSAGNQRQYPKEALRRVAFIRVAQSVGLSLVEIRAALATLPDSRTPTPADWARLSRSWRPGLEARIAALTALRDQLDACIGCGCLSLKTCKLYNPDDRAARLGAGPRYLLGDTAADAAFGDTSNQESRPCAPRTVHR